MSPAHASTAPPAAAALSCTLCTIARAKSRLPHRQQTRTPSDTRGTSLGRRIRTSPVFDQHPEQYERARPSLKPPLTTQSGERYRSRLKTAATANIRLDAPAVSTTFVRSTSQHPDRKSGTSRSSPRIALESVTKSLVSRERLARQREKVTVEPEFDAPVASLELLQREQPIQCPSVHPETQPGTFASGTDIDSFTLVRPQHNLRKKSTRKTNDFACQTNVRATPLSTTTSTNAARRSSQHIRSDNWAHCRHPEKGTWDIGI